MDNETTFLGPFIGLLFLLTNVLILIGTGALIYHRFKPHANWMSHLTVAWWGIVLCAGLALAFLIYRNFLLPYDRWERVSTYVINIALLPSIALGFLMLFFKPNS